MSHGAMETYSLIGIVSSAHLNDVARVLTDKNIGALGVYAHNAHDLVGVVTERDLVHALARGLDPEQTAVTEVMTGSPIVAEGPISRWEAARLMHEGDVRHLIVRDGEGHRIVSIRDI